MNEIVHRQAGRPASRRLVTAGKENAGRRLRPGSPGSGNEHLDCALPGGAALVHCQNFDALVTNVGEAAGQVRSAASRRPNRGFSLIELMVVLVILGLLTGLVGPRLFGRVDASKVQTAETQIKMLRGALQTYRLDIGSYPSTAEGLAALVSPPSEVADYWNGPYLEDDLPLDPWREPYRYEHPVETLQGFALYSLGADSESGGEDIDADIGYLPE